MGSKLNKRSWKVAPVTTKTYGQRTTRELLRAEFGETCTRQDLYKFKTKYGWYPQFIARDPQYRISKAEYRIPNANEPLSKHGPQGEGVKVWHRTSPDAGSVVVNFEKSKEVEPVAADASARAFRNDTDYSASDFQSRIEKIQREASELARVPAKLKEFVPYGDYELMKAIINGRKFLPVFITGLSGIGKTLNVKQACAELNREYIRANITIETDEDDLIGGFRLRNGETYFELGPVVVAMLRGSVLLVDEIDKASAKIMCLQSILEGEPLTIKKLGLTITASPGFQIFATANTKGQGDDTGKFITSTYLDEAFLERFPVMVEHDYPKPEEEMKILSETFKVAGGTLTGSTKAFIQTLCAWAANIRKAYRESAADNTISTRRLVHIVHTYHILGDSDKRNQARALTLCLNRYDQKTKTTFIQFYNKHVNDDGSPSNVGSLPEPF